MTKTPNTHTAASAHDHDTCRLHQVGSRVFGVEWMPQVDVDATGPESMIVRLWVRENVGSHFRP